MTNFDNMTDRDLDDAIALAIGGFINQQGDKAVLRATGNGAEEFWFDAWIDWKPSISIDDFADVRREIERREWSWWSSYNAGTKQYYFSIGGVYGGPDKAEANSRTRAGCIAFLKALERTRALERTDDD